MARVAGGDGGWKDKHRTAAGASPPRQGCYAENMCVRGVRISDIICHNPESAMRDQHMCTQLLAHRRALITDTDRLSDFKRGERRGTIAHTVDSSWGRRPRLRGRTWQMLISLWSRE
ncbi:hypothetical protein ABZ468_24610 [Streptomyces sp. NPDC005708]|uniref:hypothetical protein n=1 Tax=Streptomyces sp. NPDC005708 TaxID=3154564 RepID=UPI0033F0BDD4